MHSFLEDFAYLAQVLQLFAFYFLWDQLREVKASLHSQTHSNIYSHYSDTVRSFLDKPRLYPYFRNRVALDQNADPDVRAEVDTLCELTTTLFEHATLEQHNMPSTTWKDCWLPYMVASYERSPEMRRFVRRPARSGQGRNTFFSSSWLTGTDLATNSR